MAQRGARVRIEHKGEERETGEEHFTDGRASVRPAMARWPKLGRDDTCAWVRRCGAKASEQGVPQRLELALYRAREGEGASAGELWPSMAMAIIAIKVGALIRGETEQ